MNKLLKSVRSANSSKDDFIKQSIMTELSNSVKQIQYSGLDDNRSMKPEEVLEAASNLCNIIEAMFLHGLKDTMSLRFKRVLADIDERPEPSFWSPLLIISHKQIINQITNLSQIITEVGQCRAWIRLALNDCLLSSYLMTLRQDSSVLKSYYKTEAYIRDCELLEVAQRLIEGVEAFKTFTLPFNSSLLNTWPMPSLFLSGIWAPTMKSCPIAPCDDVAQAITEASTPADNTSDTVSLSSAISITSQSSGVKQIVALTEDEVLKIILEKDNDKDERERPSSSNDGYGSMDKSSGDSELERNNDSENNVTYNVNIGNSLNRRSGWSFDDTRNNMITEEPRSQLEESNKRKSSEPKSMEASYNALIESYNMLSGGFIRTPDIREVWQKFEDERKEYDVTTDDDQSPVKAEVTSAHIMKTTANSLAVQVGRIAREKGLNAQDYMCSECKQLLEVNQKPNVCAFTGDYFCDDCMSFEQIPVPARIIHNWDFKAYPVSKRGSKYIDEIKDCPVIDFKVLNPYIYSVVEEMAQLQTLRNQLNFLRAYLYTCREPVIEQLQKMMWPREYMYEHIHQYSIMDLADITNGVLAQQLQKVVTFGKDHVANCWLCSQKGFVCEVCHKPKALFPFDVENVFRCSVCFAVYHKSCLNSLKPCPKCERRKKRDELPLLGAVVNSDRLGCYLCIIYFVDLVLF
ncbi:unnamed protein product [Acanthoscelides obtectus]|uniref:RUN domain-containing protein n=1 Tax=Acanthoscelides obtectus TaxID=200917 RepID=A0A9P0PEA4_ACAOB|nr:unnamed protein product [Acanthoscelides obtectus]CAK1628252.1 Pleckstrin homology domain-containing family M member 3 [Acanthoscelides obtectus]